MASSSLPHNSNNDPHNDIQSNLIGSLNLLDASVENNISKFVFISSGGTVYGPPIDVPILETHPTNPICSYGIVKLAIEKYVMLYQKLYNLNSTILRLANPYGERQRLDAKQGVVPVFMHRAMNDLPLEVWGDGSVIRDFLYISDVVEAIRLSCIYNGNKTIFNIGSGVGMSLNEIPENFNFPIGTMFWARKNALAPLYKLELRWEDYPDEPIGYDATILHALERVIPLVASSQGYDYKMTYLKNSTR